MSMILLHEFWLISPCNAVRGVYSQVGAAIVQAAKMEDPMAWTTPVLVEICIGLEINGYLPAEF
jgi:coenzyme PQQ precursor peptide PqqA